MRKIFLLSLVLLFPSLISAQENKTREIKRINSYAKKITAFVEKNPKALELYADVSQSEKPQWKRFKSEKALEKFRKNVETYQIAYVWRKNRRVVAANFTIFSESGDWAQYTFYRFREDGTLAKIEADLRTFYGNTSVAKFLF